VQQSPYQGFHVSAEDFAANPDPRVPCVLLIDTSSSMSGRPIEELNAGLQQFRSEVNDDAIAARRVEVALFTFGGSVQLVHDFATVRNFYPPMLSTSGDTPMAEAVARGVAHLEARKEAYKAGGVAYYRPWIFLITDGAPTDRADAWSMACQAVGMGEDQKKFMFFAVGTADADFTKLKQISPARDPLRLKGLAFRELFRWLSSSFKSTSHSQPGAVAVLPPATGPTGWGEVAT
jgi:uncharacterized protein YegL